MEVVYFWLAFWPFGIIINNCDWCINLSGEMGNINGREDASSGGVDEEEGGIGNGVQEEDDGGMAAIHAPPELMGQSPPHSPMATHSPLMFTPQVLMSSNLSFFWVWQFVFFIFWYV